MTNCLEYCEIEISSEEAEKIVNDHVENIMKEKGYEFKSFHRAEGEYFPTVLYKGERNE